MRGQWRFVMLAAGLLFWAGSVACGQGAEVTLKGALQCNGMCVVNAKPADHVIVMIAVDGSPEIAAQVKKIMDDLWPDKGLDADAAVKVNDAFDKQMKYFIAADSPAPMPADMPKVGVPNHYCHSAAPYAATGTIYEKDGKKWIRVTKYEPLGLKGLKYPDKMLMPDKPFVMPDKTPLVIKINDKLSLNCIKVPPGKALMGEMEFMATRYVEQFAHLVTLTKPVAISEIPVTQETWEAVMGNNPSKLKGPLLPVENASNADVDKFCQLLTQKVGGLKVRRPTSAEWEYISRSGTSNPGFPDKYRDQGIFKEEGGKPLPIKSKKPNAWGFYDLFSPWWEQTSDGDMYPAQTPATDPQYPVGRDGMHVLFGDCGENWTISEREFEQFSGYTSHKFRIAVELGDAAK